MNIGIIILAAGESKRMGVPKQLLDIHGEMMLVKAIKDALAVENVTVTVVVGANKELITPKLKNMPINIVENTAWQTGMASSIIRGLAGSYLLNKDIEKVIFSTADMPEMSTDFFNKLIKVSEKTERTIVASKYQNAVGVPVLIKKDLFNELLDLKGDEGARQIFINHKNDIKTVPFDGLGIDLDTKEDYLNYINAEN
jgi:molybdenum cofactor cytidylyltransferase